MDEELYSIDDNTTSSSYNTDNVTDDISENIEVLEEAETSVVEVSTQTELLDYTFLLQETNTYLSCLIILQVVFIVLYAFGFLRQCFERLVNK